MHVRPEQASSLRPHFEDWTADLETAWPLVVRLEAGIAVSVCYSSRLAPGAAEAGVETVEAHRVEVML